MAEVFDGRSLGSHGFEKRVAIKRILPELAGDQTFTARLVVEAKLAVALQHANIVQALDLVRDGQDVFLVMEFINGPTLRKLLQERYLVGAGPLSLGLSTFVLHEAAVGLDYAHTQPGGAVIHADISPSNLLISRAGEVKLADFGIARREGIARAAEGKWGYMAPEQERGEPLSPRADLYALGVVFYELLTGVHPFGPREPHSPHEVEPVIPPIMVRPDLPPALSDLCLELLAPKLTARPASAKVVMERLAELRYLERWREGRSELANAVECFVPEEDAATRLAPVVERQRTEMTAHPIVVEVTKPPLTLVTRSLLLDRAGSPIMVDQGSVSWSGASTSARIETPYPAAAGLPGMPPALGPRPGSVVPLGGPQLQHTSGGTLTSAAPAAWPSALRSPTSLLAARTWIVLALAAMVGVLWGLFGGGGHDAQATPPGAQGTATAPSVIDSPPEAPAVSRLPGGAITAAPDPVDAPVPHPQAQAQAQPQPQPQPQAPTPTPTGRATAPNGQILAVDPPPEPQVPSTGAAPVSGAATAPVTEPKPAAAAKPPVARPPPPKPRPEPVRVEAGEPGTLRIYAEPWAYVQVGDVRAETPARLTLRPGRHVVRMENPELKLSRTETVRIRSNEITTLKVRWND